MGRNDIFPTEETRLNLANDPYIDEINDLIQLHNLKKNDYANKENQFSNFEASARYAGVMVEQAFNVLIGTKIARLQNLKEPGKLPNHESILDTEIDLANYIIIKRAYLRWSKAREQQRIQNQLMASGQGASQVYSPSKDF